MRYALDRGRWLWWLAFGVFALYVAVRMGVFALWREVSTPTGPLRLPNTFATVDHPFHVARAATLWRELGSGHLLRWVGQHQGGYPVEFYPLGEAWLEVAIRALSLGFLPAEGAHTVAVIALILLPGLAFAWLARIDRLSPAVALLAFALHLALPGGWYSGGYTELVQWGLVTNVAGATASLIMAPALVRFLSRGGGWPGALAATMAALAVYSNPRSLIGLVTIGVGAWVAVGLGHPRLPWRAATARLIQVGTIGALLAAPELSSLLRFGGLYAFVRYSGYERLADYLQASVEAIPWPVLALGAIGTALGLVSRRATAVRAVSITLAGYVALTAVLVQESSLAGLAPQLELTRLMPLQRLLTLYLAAYAVWRGVDWLWRRMSLDPRSSPETNGVPGSGPHLQPREGPPLQPLSHCDGRGEPNPASSAEESTGSLRLQGRNWIPAVPAIALLAVAVVVLAVLTRPIAGLPPDPASPDVPPVGLYPVAMSGQSEQADLEAAVRVADEAAEPGTAMLLLGSALSWHQPLWAPLWTTRPLYYDNWLWYWQPHHAGTPGYVFQAGNAYPDPERTLDATYLARHGIGAVLVTGPVRAVAVASPLLRLLRQGVYDAYAVIDPVTTVTFGQENATATDLGNQRIAASVAAPAPEVTIRQNWYPRWQAVADGEPVSVAPTSDGYMRLAPPQAASHVEFVYAVQPIDWLSRVLALVGAVGEAWFVVRSVAGVRRLTGWYAPWLRGARDTTSQ